MKDIKSNQFEYKYYTKQQKLKLLVCFSYCSLEKQADYTFLVLDKVKILPLMSQTNELSSPDYFSVTFLFFLTNCKNQLQKRHNELSFVGWG